jgi:glycosyltransferase involved in cell wall biosynthesis
MVPKDYRQTMTFFNRLFSDLFFDRSISRADILLAISNYTAREIKLRYPVRRSGEITVGCGIDVSIFRPVTLTNGQRYDLCSRYGIKEPFLLFVGTVEPRKNLEFMLSLMPELASAGFSLLIVGARGWGKSSIAEIVSRPGFPVDMIVFSGYLPIDDLPWLYSTAAVYVSTSLNEGFGLPQLEAMSCGCPVVAPYNSAMIEVVEGAGITVKGWEPSDWKTAVHTAYENKERYKELGFRRSAQYCWPVVVRSIAEHLVTYEDLP